MRPTPFRRIARSLSLARSAARIRSDLEEEIGFDIEMRTHELMQQGVDAASARAKALEQFGDVDTTRRYCEEIDMRIEAASRRSDVIQDLRSDLRIAWRAMRRTPAFAAVVLATLALGIGANTAIFSLVRRVLIAAPPFRAPDQLYRLYTQPSTVDGDDDKLSAVELNDLAAQSHSLAGLTAFGNYGGLTYSDDRTAEPWQTVSVDTGFFDVLGIRPVLGRAFRAQDYVRGAPPVVILTYKLWQRTFGGDPSVVGRTVLLNGTAFNVIGVLPENFVGPTFVTDALLPLNFGAVLQSPGYSRSRAWRSVIRLQGGVTFDQFHTELAVLQPRIQSSYPQIKNAGTFRPVPLRAAMVGGAGPVLILVM